MSGRLTRERLRWLTDYQECCAGEHGDWWRAVADVAAVREGSRRQPPDGESWQRWRALRLAAGAQR